MIIRFPHCLIYNTSKSPLFLQKISVFYKLFGTDKNSRHAFSLIEGGHRVLINNTNLTPSAILKPIRWKFIDSNMYAPTRRKCSRKFSNTGHIQQVLGGGHPCHLVRNACLKTKHNQIILLNTNTWGYINL